MAAALGADAGTCDGYTTSRSRHAVTGNGLRADRGSPPARPGLWRQQRRQDVRVEELLVDGAHALGEIRAEELRVQPLDVGARVEERAEQHRTLLRLLGSQLRALLRQHGREGADVRQP